MRHVDLEMRAYSQLARHSMPRRAMVVVPDLSILPQESDIPQEFDTLSDQAAQIARLERLHVEQDHINIAQAAEIQCLNARVQVTFNLVTNTWEVLCSCPGKGDRDF